MDIREIISLFESQPFDIIHFHFIRDIDIHEITKHVPECTKIGLSLHEYYPFCSTGTLLHDNNVQCKIRNVQSCDCRFEQGRIDKFRQKTIELINDRFAFLIASDRFSYEIASEFMRGEAAIKYIPYAITPDVIKNRMITNESFLISYIGTNSEIKWVNVLMSLLEKLDKISFETIGVQFQFFFPAISQFDIPDNLKMLEEKGKCKIYMGISRLDIYTSFRHNAIIIPSIWNETGPMTIYEAFANKIPVIISDQESLKAKVLDRHDSYVFRTWDEKDLLKGILWMRKNYDKVILNNTWYRYNSLEDFNHELMAFLNGL